MKTFELMTKFREGEKTGKTSGLQIHGDKLLRLSTESLFSGYIGGRGDDHRLKDLSKHLSRRDVKVSPAGMTVSKLKKLKNAVELKVIAVNSSVIAVRNKQGKMLVNVNALSSERYSTRREMEGYLSGAIRLEFHGSLDYSKVVILEVGKPVTVTQKRTWGGDDTQTFSGAVLYETLDGECYLYDQDPSKSNGLATRTVKLPRRVKTLAEAKDAQRPETVSKDAVKVGDWYFTPSSAPKLPKLTELEKAYAYIGLCRTNFILESDTADMISGLGKGDFERLRKLGVEYGRKVVRRLCLPNAGSNAYYVEGVVLDGVTYVRGAITTDQFSVGKGTVKTLDGWHVATPSAVNSKAKVQGVSDYEDA